MTFPCLLIQLNSEYVLGAADVQNQTPNPAECTLPLTQRAETLSVTREVTQGINTIVQRLM